MSTSSYSDPGEVPPSPRAMMQYEQNRRKETDERDAVQKKTFTKWANKHLLKAGRRILDLFEDLKDGHNLISLLEVLAHDTLPREKGRMRFHKIQNVQIALDYLGKKGIKLVNIRSDEIVDGNPKLTLGLIWTIILHFQRIQKPPIGVPASSEKKKEIDINRRYKFIYCLQDVKPFTEGEGLSKIRNESTMHWQMQGKRKAFHAIEDAI
ncbi:hypothetical protein FSP39_009189 [Pinctada imbricata]|uniref:Calponin-homology (CH) domain-containing protein n=1 Tax=Pinctada imbricata TaxID=66713 RepID=A0AA89BP40_PINIB|nr:hypothetical protein FSP39_009189 [Pinctada imbricata]